jgi:hypothetical protein
MDEPCEVSIDERYEVMNAHPDADAPGVYSDLDG